MQPGRRPSQIWRPLTTPPLTTGADSEQTKTLLCPPTTAHNCPTARPPLHRSPQPHILALRAVVAGVAHAQRVPVRLPLAVAHAVVAAAGALPVAGGPQPPGGAGAARGAGPVPAAGGGVARALRDVEGAAAARAVAVADAVGCRGAGLVAGGPHVPGGAGAVPGRLGEARGQDRVPRAGPVAAAVLRTALHLVLLHRHVALQTGGGCVEAQTT